MNKFGNHLESKRIISKNRVPFECADCMYLLRLSKNTKSIILWFITI